MKTFLILFTSLVGVSSLPAQSFSLDWRTISGGGSTSSGGSFSVQGTIGQSVAGSPLSSSNGATSIMSGFWSFQSLEWLIPQLTITTLSPGRVQVSWSPSAPGFILIQKNSIDSGAWTVAPSGTNNPATIQTAPGPETRFYKLGRQ